jgi:class 3 adenylate cyclase
MKVEMNGNNNINKGDPSSIKEPVYDVSGYTTNLAVKMTALTNPNHIVIGQQVHDVLDDGQKSMHQHLNLIQQ